MNELVGAGRAEDLLILTNFPHRPPRGPPCTITDDESREGLDRALGVADEYYVGNL